MTPVMRSFRAVLLTKPFELILSFVVLILGVLMIAFPELLEHTPISFESRGLVHHVFHYSLIAGSAMTLFGLLCKHADLALRVEFGGLVILWAALAENTIAIVADSGPTRGLGLGLRIAVLAFIAVRCYALVAQPVVYVLRGARDE